MDSYIVVLIIVGLAGLTMSWLPVKLSNLPLSYPVIFIIIGALLYKLPIPIPFPSLEENNEIILRITEGVVIISLMGTGLSIDTPLNFKSWSIPLKLIFLTMILSIASVTAMGYWFLCFSIPTALLLGAALAPTDPVLASDVQVGPPNEEAEDHVRFSLTAEAGLNDGMAFPFVWMAILLVGHNATWDWFGNWLSIYFLYKIAGGIAVGFLIGRLLAYIFFALPEKSNFPKIREGFVALAATLLVYGVAEAIKAYGFLAVFTCALTLSRIERQHRYHREMHHFIDQIERFLLVLVLIPFGGLLVNGLLDALTINGAILGLIFILIVRPFFGIITMAGHRFELKEKLAIAFLGIRGVGSIYYLAFAFHTASFQNQKEVWAISGFVILVSIVLHGVTATPLMKHLDTRRQTLKEELLRKSKKKKPE